MDWQRINMSNTETIRWLATVWALLALAGLVYFISRAWKRKIVSLFGRSGSKEFSREEEPILYWGMMAFYLVIALGLALILCLRTRNLLQQISHK
jgi:H+/Cl- antiporter ClcA